MYRHGQLQRQHRRHHGHRGCGNIFFYDVGRRTTSDVYDAYAYKMGLGTRTGVEYNEGAAVSSTTKNDSNYIALTGRPGRYRSWASSSPLSSWRLTPHAGQPGRYRTHFVKAILDTNTGKVRRRPSPR